MIDDVFQAALSALVHHLDQAGASYSLDEGDITWDGHRLSLSIAFDGFVSQGGMTLAPLDVQLHLDSDNGDRFRVGTLGVGKDRAGALQAAIAEWHLLAASPLLAALGASVDKRRAKPVRLAGWELFAGRAGIRGAVPPQLASAPFSQALHERLRQLVSDWKRPSEETLRSAFFMVTRDAQQCDVQAAVDGLVDTRLVELIAGLDWPVGDETYLYKQLFVLRFRPEG